MLLSLSFDGIGMFEFQMYFVSGMGERGGRSSLCMPPMGANWCHSGAHGASGRAANRACSRRRFDLTSDSGNSGFELDGMPSGLGQSLLTRELIAGLGICVS